MPLPPRGASRHVGQLYSPGLERCRQPYTLRRRSFKRGERRTVRGALRMSGDDPLPGPMDAVPNGYAARTSRTEAPPSPAALVPDRYGAPPDTLADFLSGRSSARPVWEPPRSGEASPRVSGLLKWRGSGCVSSSRSAPRVPERPPGWIARPRTRRCCLDPCQIAPSAVLVLFCIHRRDYGVTIVAKISHFVALSGHRLNGLAKLSFYY